MRGSPATAHNAPWGFARFAGESGSVANWRAVIAAALATFSVVTTEMLPVGLLTPIADSLAASTGGAAWLISLPALVAAVCAPLLVLPAGGVDRRHLLCGLLALLTVANLASAAAPTLVVLLDGPMRGAVLLVLWGLAYGGVSVALMTWVIKAAPQAMEAASALYVSVFNIGIGAGAWLGGSVADQHGAGAPLWAGIALAAGCLFAALGLRRPSPH